MTGGVPREKNLINVQGPKREEILNAILFATHSPYSVLGVLCAWALGELLGELWKYASYYAAASAARNLLRNG